MNAYEILGRVPVKDIRDVVGANGFDMSALASMAAELSQRGAAAYEQHEASQKDTAAQSAGLARAIAADAAWANAEAVLEIASKSGDANRIAAATALQAGASSEAMNAGAGLDAGSTSRRMAAASQASKNAASESLANPADATKAAMMRGWQKVASRSALSPLSGGAMRGGAGGSFLTKVHAGIPMWGWLAGGAFVATGLVLLLRRK